MFNWLGKNLSTFILALILAVVVWVSAVVAADPNEERLYPRDVELEVIGLDSSMIQVAEIPEVVRLTLNAPRSIWQRLTQDTNAVSAWIDLSDFGKGEHTAEVNVEISQSPVRVISVDPQEVQVELEPFVDRAFPVQLIVTGDPALGYRKGTALIEPEEVIISGPESIVNQVESVTAAIDISGANESINRTVFVQPRDENGKLVTDMTVSPASVAISQPINLLGGFRNVVVKVSTIGEVDEGYWLTNVSVNPPSIVVFSANPELVNQLPGYVETNPIDLTGLNDDVDIRATLDLPEGITMVGEESVLVKLSIAAREGSLPIILPIQSIGLSPEYLASFSPETVNLILSGPLPLLTNLTPASIRVVVNLSGLEPGSYQVTPEVDLVPSEVKVESIEPETVLARITLAPTPTPTPEAVLSGANAQAKPSGENLPTPTATRQP